MNQAWVHMPHPCIARRTRIVAALVGVFLALTVGGAARAEGAPDALAVLPLTMQEPESLEADWSLGLAEFLEIELARRGVPVVERQRLAPLLSERRMGRMGLLDDAPADWPRLPRVAWLVGGRVTQVGSNRFRMELDLVRADDATHVASLRHEGAYPGDVGEAIETLAESLIDHIEPRGARSAALVPGFTDVPEAAAMFYRGQEHFAAGRLAHAIAAFQEAVYYGNDAFPMAKAWQMRVFSHAGLHPFAAAVREQLLEADDDASVLALAAVNRLERDERDERGERGALTLAVIEGDPAATPLAGALRQRLAAEPNLTVRSTDWLNEVARERDLRLTGEFEASALPGRGWLTADVVVLLEAAENESDEHALAGVRARLCDAVTGEVLATLEPARAAEHEHDDPAATLASRITRELAELPESLPGLTAELDGAHERRALPAPTQLEPDTELYAGRDRMVHDEGRRQIHFQTGRYERTLVLMRRLIDDPVNLDTLFACTGIYHRTFRPTALEQMIRLIDEHRNTPNAAAWLMAALHERHEYVYHRGHVRPHERFAREEPVRQRYAKLLEWFEGSPEARLVDYAHAHELIDAGGHEEAAALLGDLARDMPELSFTGDVELSDVGWMNLHFFLARTLYRLGRVEEAAAHIRQCRERIESANHRWRISPRFEWRLNTPRERSGWQLRESTMYSHRHYFEQQLGYWTDLRPEINALEQRLLDQAPEPSDADYLSSRELFQKAITAAGEEAVEWHRRSLEEFVLEWNERGRVPHRVLLQTATVRLNSPDRAGTKRWLASFVERLGELPDVHHRTALQVLAGDYEKVLRAHDEDIASGHVTNRMRAFLSRVELNSVVMSPREQARWMTEALDRLERELPEQFERPGLLYIALVEVLAPRLAELGEPVTARAWLERALERNDLPLFYRMRLKYRMALVHMAAGDGFAASELLREIGESLGDRDRELPEWSVEKRDDRSMLTHLRFLDPRNAGELVHQSRLRLRHVRRFGGFESLIRPPQPHVPSGKSFDPADVYALLWLLDVDANTLTNWMGRGYWIREAWAGLGKLETQRDPLLAQLLHARRLIQPRYSNRDHHVQRVLQVRQRLGHMAKHPPLTELSWWALFPHDCNAHRWTAEVMRLRGDASVGMLPVLTLMEGTYCTVNCPPAIRRAHQAVAAAPREADLPTIAAMLDHERSNVRYRAADVLARWAEVTVPRDAQQRPTDEAVTWMKSWWQRHGARRTGDHPR